MIITIRDERKTFAYDMEIAEEVSVDKAIKDIFEILNILNPEFPVDISRYKLFHNRTGRSLAGEESVQEAGIWNGDYITLVSRG